MPYKQVLEDARERMRKAVEHLEHEFAGVRTGKASPALVEDIKVEYYGTHTALREIAGITTPEPRLIVIQPWDQNAVPNIVKAIQTSSLGITPVDDGRVVRVPIPELTEERRRDLDKHIKHMAEDARVAIRNIRREENERLKKLQKEGKITEDELRHAEKDVQKLTDDFIAKVNELLKHKEQEIFTV
ncbi:MAG: ribosome recycling factor [bacterium]|nr:ribosome recycling factor [bacterium]